MENIKANKEVFMAEEKVINGIECVLVKAGTFTMGSKGYRNDNSVQVTLTKDYWIGKYPITQAQYKKVIGSNPSGFKGDNNPVDSVNWHDSVAFCQKVGNGCRLPTEAEWEFAARGGNESEGYIYSGSDNKEDVAWNFWGNNKTQPVGQKKPNELGIYDMSENVWEWCNNWYNDWYGNYPSGSLTDGFRVVRGGSWSGDAEGCRVAYRDGYPPGLRYRFLGFRVVFPD